MVLAEKIGTALERGEQNTRWRDFTDIASIARSRRIDGVDLQEAVEVVARYRESRSSPSATCLRACPHSRNGSGKSGGGNNGWKLLLPRPSQNCFPPPFLRIGRYHRTIDLRTRRARHHRYGEISLTRAASDVAPHLSACPVCGIMALSERAGLR